MYRSWLLNGVRFSTWSTLKPSALLYWSLLLAIKQLKISFIWSTREHHWCNFHFTSCLLLEYKIIYNGWSNTACGFEEFIQNFPFLSLECSCINDTTCFLTCLLFYWLWIKQQNSFCVQLQRLRLKTRFYVITECCGPFEGSKLNLIISFTRLELKPQSWLSKAFQSYAVHCFPFFFLITL